MYEDDEQTANARLAARLPYIFAASRFAHYLMVIVRDKIGSFKENRDIEIWLQEWLNNYIDGAPFDSAEETKARKPLSEASINIRPNPNPDDEGTVLAELQIRPNYQLEGLTRPMRLTLVLPFVGEAAAHSEPNE